MIDYAKVLNPAQYEAVTSTDDSVLVVAGAGSGKTRAIVHRLAWLTEQGVPPEAILLLTFTRKAAHEMLGRAANLLGFPLNGIAGGTFHSFAYSVLRRFSPPWLGDRSFTLMDQADINDALRQCREAAGIGKKDSSFPKTATIAGILSKARNKEQDITEVLRADSFHLLPHAEALVELGAAYANFKREKALLDYDDLLFELEAFLSANDRRVQNLRAHISHILVDEYQDTNLVQARITRLLAGGESQSAKVMAVGDEAQSIYAFRGANVRNILDFPKIFPGARVIRLEENYRSTQPILDVANDILAHATESYSKNLFTRRPGGEAVRLFTPLSDASEAQIVVSRIEELLATHRPHEIAVLFRAGFHSYPLENALRHAGIAFRKYGGLRFVEAAHIKDVLSFARLALNPLDLPAFSRVAAMCKGVGPKTTARLYGILSRNDPDAMRKAFAKYPDLLADLTQIENLRSRRATPAAFFEKLIDHYRPRLESLYPEDWPSRLQGLEEITHMAEGYEDLDLFVADLALETPEEENSHAEDQITLSTVHSAKGLEWSAVLILDLVEDRFPSRHAQARPEDFEEERRLFYVACTRAKQTLDLFAPATIYSRAEHGSLMASQSPFLRELNQAKMERHVERFGGVLERLGDNNANNDATMPSGKATPALSECGMSQKSEAERGVCGKSGYCRHRIFGRGKIIKQIDKEKVRVNFPGFGLKIILADYLIMED